MSHALRCTCCSGVAFGIELEPPGVVRLAAQHDVEAREPLAARDQQRDLLARPVLFEPAGELFGANAELVDRDDLVVDVDAGVVGRRAAPHLRDEQAPAVDARRHAEPGPAPPDRRCARRRPA